MSAVLLYLLVMRAFALYFLGKCGPRFAVPASGCKTELEEMIGTIFLTKRSVKRGAQAARIMRHVTRLPRRTIDTALLLHR